MPVALSLREALGLMEPLARLRESIIAIRGAEDVPPAVYGVSSLNQFRIKIGLPLWRGRFVVERKAILSNLFNHLQTPIEKGWSVKMTQMRDFRGRSLTYDSHNGTDFAVPVGSTFVSPGPGRIVRVYAEYNRGGNKIVIDHGNGLLSSFAHLARFLVRVGQDVKRGEPIAISGYSGLDAVISGPFGVPHTHFNAWYDAQPVDPFGYDDQASLWAGGGLPLPPTDDDGDFEPTVFDEDAVNAAIAACRTPHVRSRMLAINGVYERGCELVSEWNYYPTRFPHRPRIVANLSPRSGRWSLPCSPQEIDGVVFADQL